MNNLKHAWQFVFESLEYPLDLSYICHINQVVGSNLIYGAGYLRKIPVRMGGTSWAPEMPDKWKIEAELKDVLKIASPTERAIVLMLWAMRRQMFPDGNKRTAMLAANQIMLKAGSGILSVPVEEQDRFTEMLVKYYETSDMTELKQFVYDICVDGVDFPPIEQELPQPSMKKNNQDMER